MTLHELSSMTYKLCVGHYINDVKRASIKDVEQLLSTWLRNENSKFIAEIPLPDGKWLCRFSRIGSYYDLYIPDTREQEQRLFDSLCSH